MSEPIDGATRREMVHRLRTLAVYVQRGGPIEWVDPPEPRGKRPKTPDKVTFSWTVFNVRAFDDISWDLMKRGVTRRPSQ